MKRSFKFIFMLSLVFLLSACAMITDGIDSLTAGNEQNNEINLNNEDTVDNEENVEASTVATNTNEDESNDNVNNESTKSSCTNPDEDAHYALERIDFDFFIIDCAEIADLDPFENGFTAKYYVPNNNWEDVIDQYAAYDTDLSPHKNFSGEKADLQIVFEEDHYIDVFTEQIDEKVYLRFDYHDKRNAAN